MLKLCDHLTMVEGQMLKLCDHLTMVEGQIIKLCNHLTMVARTVASSFFLRVNSWK